MSLAWRPGIAGCSVDDRIVLLDLTTGRYRGVSAAASAAFARSAATLPATAEDAAALAPLIASGLLSTSKVMQAPNVRSVAMRSRARDAIASCRLREIACAIATQTIVRSALGLLGFPRMHRAVQAVKRWCLSGRVRRGGPSGRDNTAALDRLAAAFMRADVLMGRRDRCLARSLAFLLLASLRRIDVELVIGVRLAPFLAHAWIEKDGCVLNDDLDEVAQFVAILSI